MAVLGKSREFMTRFTSAFAENGLEGTEPASTTLSRVMEVLLFSLLVILVFHIYLHSREGPFVFDDLPNILDNPHIRITSLDWDSLRRAAFDSPAPNRAVVNISFALNYYFHQYAPEGYRLVNVLVHLCNGLLLYFFLKSTLQTPGLINRYQDFSLLFIPFAAVCIWLVNPLHTQSVSYIVQRMNTMATMFYMLAFLLYVRLRLLDRDCRYRWLLLGGGLLAYLLALGCKENAVTLPFFIFLYEWYFFRDLSRTWFKKNHYWLAVIFLFMVCMAIIYLDGNPLTRILYEYQSRDFTLTQRILTQFRVVIFYVFLFLFPHPSRLNLDHHFTLSHSLLDPPSTLLSILVVCCLIAMAVIKARRSPLLSFCIIWFLGNLAIESSVIGLEIVFEHRTYLPTILFSIVLVTIIYRFVNHQWARRLILCLIVVAGSTWTHERSQVWSASIALWSDSSNKSPGKARPYVNLGVAHKEQGQLERAIGYLSRAVRIKPEYSKARYNLSSALLSKGDYRSAEVHAREALRSTPDDTDTINTLGIALAGQGRADEAISSFLQALDLNPHEAGTHYNLSLALANAGQLSKAEKYCLEALRIEPDYRAARMHLYKVRSNMKLHKLPIERPFSINIANLP